MKCFNENLTQHLQTFTGKSKSHQIQSPGHLWTQRSAVRSSETLLAISRGYSVQQEELRGDWLYQTVAALSIKRNRICIALHFAESLCGGVTRLILVTIHLLTSETSDAAYKTAVAKSLIENMKLLPLLTAASCFTPPGPSFFVLQVMKFFFPDHMSQDEGGKSCQEQRWAATWTWSRGDREQNPESYIRMCSTQEQTLSQVKDPHEPAMHVNEDTSSKRLGATNKTCLYFIIATLAVSLVFALATVMVLAIQRTVRNFLFYSLAFSFFLSFFF